ncbi:MAG: superfamily II DNA or RNA helicase [Saprospiraceae bacterium]|jgi:superfamily II DNA or RNA helicase
MKEDNEKVEEKKVIISEEDEGDFQGAGFEDDGEDEIIIVDEEEKVMGKKLYDYQEEDLKSIFERIHNCPSNYNLVYQLPTGGGKTVVFSEIARRYIEMTGKRVFILTHRIELSKQTSRMLSEFGVKNMVINSQVKEIPDYEDYMCFVAMVETLHNRLNDEKVTLEDVGLVIIDEAHYNSFRKLFKYFETCFILGVTATPLSSSVKLPMKDSYDELLVGSSIQSLIAKKYLSKATTLSYDVGLGSLKVGVNGDYTVASSDELYNSLMMRSKLLYAYNQTAKKTKTLIFNNGINTSQYVYETFRAEGYPIRHLDNTHSKKERKFILEWFKQTPGAILTSVSILTTGFDEPTIETIVLNRATRSLSLYLQMIGRGSRILPTKSTFQVIDMGNNIARFGPWSSDFDWQKIFRNPTLFLDTLITDEDLERLFKYKMPDHIRQKFANSENIIFDVDEEYKKVVSEKLKSEVVIERAIQQHHKIITENAESLMDALGLIRLLRDDIHDRIRHYCYNISNSTRNFRDWAVEDYTSKLKKRAMNEF